MDTLEVFKKEDSKEFFGYIGCLFVVFLINIALISAGFHQISHDSFDAKCRNSNIYEICIGILVISTIIMTCLMSLSCKLSFWYNTYLLVKDKNMIQSILIVLIVGTSLGYFLFEINKSCVEDVSYTILYKDLVFNIVIWLLYLVYFVIKIVLNCYVKNNYAIAQ